MVFAGICLTTKDVKRLSNFYKAILQTNSDCDSDVHQDIHTQGAALAILKCEDHELLENQNMSMVFTVDDVDAEYERLKLMNIDIVDLPTVQPWGAKNMRFTDPDGNYIVFRSFIK